MTNFTIDDMISSAIEQKPETFKDAFSNLMAAKVAQAVEDKKQELAHSYFNDDGESEDTNMHQPDLDNDHTEVENA